MCDHPFILDVLLYCGQSEYLNKWNLFALFFWSVAHSYVYKQVHIPSDWAF